jgi:uncharacterized protein (TIGR03435 family)
VPGQRTRRVVAAVAALVALSNPGRPHAQSAARDAPGIAFEVASVKPNPAGPGPSAVQLLPGGRFNAINVSLRELIRLAFGVQVAQIAGPDWIRTERFDVIAKAEDEPAALAVGPSQRLLAMLRRLLTERFALAVHHEAREQAIYALLTMRTDDRLGPQLRPSSTDCRALPARDATWTLPPTPRSPGARPDCDLAAGPGRFVAGGVPMARLASALSPFVARVVIDRTSLAGLFDFDLSWTPEGLPPRSPEAAAANQPIRLNGVEIDPNGPDLFTALREQLGLRLDSTRGPADLLVVDRIERPTPD